MSTFVELSAKSLRDLETIMAASTTQLAPGSQVLVSPMGADSLLTSTQSSVTQQSFARYLSAELNEANNQALMGLRFKGNNALPTFQIPATPVQAMGMPVSPTAYCPTCTSDACACVLLTSLEASPYSLPGPNFTTTPYNASNSGWRLSLVSPNGSAPPNVLHRFMLAYNSTASTMVYTSSPPHSIHIPPGAYFVLDGPILFSNFQHAGFGSVSWGSVVPGANNWLHNITFKVVLSGRV